MVSNLLTYKVRGGKSRGEEGKAHNSKAISFIPSARKNTLPPHNFLLLTRRLAGNPNVRNLAIPGKLLVNVPVSGIPVQVPHVHLGFRHACLLVVAA